MKDSIFSGGILPKRIKTENGPEFISKELDKWAYESDVILEFPRHGKPTDNAFIESFNGRFLDECLNVNGILSLDDAKEKIEAFKDEQSFPTAFSTRKSTAGRSD